MVTLLLGAVIGVTLQKLFPGPLAAIEASIRAKIGK